MRSPCGAEVLFFYRGIQRFFSWRAVWCLSAPLPPALGGGLAKAAVPTRSFFFPLTFLFFQSVLLWGTRVDTRAKNLRGRTGRRRTGLHGRGFGATLGRGAYTEMLRNFGDGQ